MSIYDPSIFRAYDIRGIYPSQMNEKVAYAAGQAFVHILGAKRVVTGRDVRSSGKSLQEALIRGITDAGATAIDIGVISTEMLYFAAGSLECDGGLSITASHNPANWNGIKTVKKGALPMTRETELGQIYEFIQSNRQISQMTKGQVEEIDILPRYIEFLAPFLPKELPSLSLVANPNFGANGHLVDQVCQTLPLSIVRLNWERDGSFPKGTPDPLLPKNRQEICQRVVEEKAHFGVAWDADADRCFFYDNQGRFFHGYYITALLIKHFLNLEPGGKVVGERRLIWANQDAASEAGGELVLSRTGHMYIKAKMREAQAVFGGEMSGHYYYRDFFFCDNGLISFLTILSLFAKQIEQGKTVADLLDFYLEKYPISLQELNYITPKAKEILSLVQEKYKDGELDNADGISISYPNWRFNLRLSDNEPLMRLNCEAKSPQELETHLNELKKFLSEAGAELRNDEA